MGEEKPYVSPWAPAGTPAGLEACERLINGLSRATYVWRMWHALNRAGRDKALNNAAAEVEAVVMRYLEQTGRRAVRRRSGRES